MSIFIFGLVGPGAGSQHRDYYYYFKNRRWDLVFSNGLTLKLPAKNKKDSIKIFKKLIDNDKLTNTKIIDLRVSNQIIMTNNNE